MTRNSMGDWPGQDVDQEIGDAASEGGEDASPLHPIDREDEDWRDEQYGRIRDPRRLLAEGRLHIDYDEDVAAIQGIMSEVLPLTHDQFRHAKSAGNSDLANAHIRNGVALAGCFIRLMDKRDTLLKSIGRGR